MIGFLVGLFLGGEVVQFIQSPLRRALITYYTQQADRLVNQRLTELKELGYTDELLEETRQKKMYPEELYLNPAEVAKALGLPENGTSGDVGALSHEGPAGNPGHATNSVTNPSTPGSEPNAATSNVTATSQVAAPVDSEPELVRVTVWRPIADDRRVRTSSLNAHEAFTIYIKAALLVGAVLASPWIFYQVWKFVAAGLYWHERKFVYLFLPFSLGLFLAGVFAAFFLVFEPVLQFLLAFNSWLNIDPDPRISEWLNFVLILPLGFGITFQLPLVMLFLERIGVFTVQSYLSKWRIAVVVIFVIAMLFTPPDPWSMIAMALPLSGLYFGGVLLCVLLPRRRAPFLPPPE